MPNGLALLVLLDGDEPDDKDGSLAPPLSQTVKIHEHPEAGVMVRFVLADGRTIDIVPEFFRYKVGVNSAPGQRAYDRVWLYAGLTVAILAVTDWINAGLDDEPAGWFKHPYTKRERRYIGGTFVERYGER